MNDDPSRKRLGRGLAALIGEMDNRQQQAVSPAVDVDRTIPIEFIVPNPRNPRRNFSEDELADLAQSIREHGIVQPVVVRAMGEGGRYEIIAGERRWRAAQRAGLAQLPVIIRNVDDRTALELAIVENVQRADLNPVEEAHGYQELINEHNYTQADLGQIIGKSRSHVTNTLRLLRLSQDIQDLLVDGSLSAGHARTLVGSADPASLARRIVEQGLSVRQAEQLAQDPSTSPEKKERSRAADKDADTLALEKALSDITGMKVAISHRSNGGDVKISYKSLDQLDDLCRRLKS